jgi:hypothetical protein
MTLTWKASGGELLDRVIREHFEGIPQAKELVLASGNGALSPNERECAEERLIALQREQLLAARVPTVDPPRFRPAREIMRDPAPHAVIRGCLYRGRKTVMVSEPNLGKSFVELSQAASIADPRQTSWCGQPIDTHGAVAIITFEPDALNTRLQALQEQGLDLTDVHALRAFAPLSPRVGRDSVEASGPGAALADEALTRLVEELASNGRPPLVAVYIDTVRASMSGSEDDSGDVAAYLRAVDRVIASAPGAALILLHHSGWQDGDPKRRRERGSSAFRGNVDVTLWLEREGKSDDPCVEHLVLRCLKNRDEERTAPIRMIRRRVVLEGRDSRGEPRTSCVIEPDTRSGKDLQAPPARGLATREKADELAVLRIMASQTVTSIEDARRSLNWEKSRTAKAIARVRQRGLASVASQRKPYTLTEMGRALISRTESDSVVPECLREPLAPTAQRVGPGSPSLGEPVTVLLVGTAPCPGSDASGNQENSKSEHDSQAVRHDVTTRREPE